MHLICFIRISSCSMSHKLLSNGLWFKILGFDAKWISRNAMIICGDKMPTRLYVRFAGCSPQTGHTALSSTPYRQLEYQARNTAGSNHLYNTLELLMMGIMVPETCWASNKICNKNSSHASSWHIISTYYRRCTLKTTSKQWSLFEDLTENSCFGEFGNFQLLDVLEHFLLTSYLRQKFH